MKLTFNQKDYSEQSDEMLLHLFRKKQDPKIISIFYERYGHLVYGVCLKYLKDQHQSEDITMQVFEKLLNKLHLYEIQHFKSWLYSVAKNECMMLYRKKNPIIPFSDYPDKKNGNDVEFHQELHPSEEIDQVAIDELNKAIATLNEEQRSCIKLFYIENKSYKEIEEETGFKIKQVKSYIQNGKRNLKNRLSNNVR